MEMRGAVVSWFVLGLACVYAERPVITNVVVVGNSVTCEARSTNRYNCLEGTYDLRWEWCPVSEGAWNVEATNGRVTLADSSEFAAPHVEWILPALRGQGGGRFYRLRSSPTPISPTVTTNWITVVNSGTASVLDVALRLEGSAHGLVMQTNALGAQTQLGPIPLAGTNWMDVFAAVLAGCTCRELPQWEVDFTFDGYPLGETFPIVALGIGSKQILLEFDANSLNVQYDWIGFSSSQTYEEILNRVAPLPSPCPYHDY
jgi:hypothetical protein